MGEEGKNIYEIIIPSLIQKINDTPFPESSEDLRLKVVLIFIKFMNHKECLLKNLP